MQQLVGRAAVTLVSKQAAAQLMLVARASAHPRTGGLRAQRGPAAGGSGRLSRVSCHSGFHEWIDSSTCGAVIFVFVRLATLSLLRLQGDLGMAPVTAGRSRSPVLSRAAVTLYVLAPLLSPLSLAECVCDLMAGLERDDRRLVLRLLFERDGVLRAACPGFSGVHRCHPAELCRHCAAESFLRPHLAASDRVYIFRLSEPPGDTVELRGSTLLLSAVVSELHSMKKGLEGCRALLWALVQLVSQPLYVTHEHDKVLMLSAVRLSREYLASHIDGNNTSSDLAAVERVQSLTQRLGEILSFM
ncbi:unnamed protein product [Sphagnum jensenii]|uniref:Uncharacterized protein n=1 Tax=Sphagnum jensenii TaxID=128206 RepID=A0ABP0VFT6_9BRYO